MQFGKRVTRCEEDADGVTVWFTDGSSASGDLLIAADGSHSALRPWVLGFLPRSAATPGTSTGTVWWK